MPIQLPIQDRRRHPRFPHAGQVRISWEGTAGFPEYAQARVLDISEGGIRIEASEPIPAGAKVSLRADHIDIAGAATVKHVTRRRSNYILGLELGHASTGSSLTGIGDSANHPLDQAYPYLILDTRVENVREAGGIRRRAVLVAVGIDEHGQRCLLGMELANPESEDSWTDFIGQLRRRGLHGVQRVVSDVNEGLRIAVAESLPEAVWERCYVRFLGNVLDYLPRQAYDDCRMQLRGMYARHNIEESGRGLAAWLQRCGQRYQQLCDWVETSGAWQE